MYRDLIKCVNERFNDVYKELLNLDEIKDIEFNSDIENLDIKPRFVENDEGKYVAVFNIDKNISFDDININIDNSKREFIFSYNYNYKNGGPKFSSTYSELLPYDLDINTIEAEFSNNTITVIADKIEMEIVSEEPKKLNINFI